jgi:hypothetical protein
VALVRIDPGNDEDRVALFDGPFDEGLLRIEIENVELVDPGRHDQQRAFEHGFGRRLVLDDLTDSFWAITLPSETAMFSPTLNFEASDWRSFNSPLPAAMSSASIFMPRPGSAPLEATISL